MNPWVAICALLGLGAAVLAWALGPVADPRLHPLAWSALSWLSRPWTLWTSAWVNTSPGQYAGNLLALLALAVAGAWLKAGRAAALALLAAWPLGIAALALWPGVSHYSGLGGPIHAAAMVLWAHLALHQEHKPLSFVLFAGMVLKLGVERAWVYPVSFDPGWGFNVVFAAHLTGAVAGAVCGLLAVLLPGRPAR